MFAKSYHLHWITSRANILCKYLINIYFFNFGRGFCGFFSLLFTELQLLVIKKNWNIFCSIVLLFVCTQKVSQIFKTLFQTEDIDIFVLGRVFFSKYVHLKTYFSDEKHQRWNLRHAFVEKLSKTKGKNSIIGRLMANLYIYIILY